MNQNVIFKVSDSIRKTAHIKSEKPKWTKFSFHEADKEWLVQQDIEYFHQYYLTLLSDIQAIECVINRAVTIEIQSLRNHIYLLYMFGDSLHYPEDSDTPHNFLASDHNVAGYLPKGDTTILLQPGKYTIIYISMLREWLLDTGRKFNTLEPLYRLLENEHHRSKVLPSFFINAKEEGLLILLRLAKYKSKMDLDNIIHTQIEFLLYRYHQKLENSLNSTITHKQQDIERLRNHILAQIEVGINPYVYAICSELGLIEWEMRKIHKQQYGEGIKEFVNKTRIIKAQSLLRAGHQVNYVANNLSYSSPSQLSKQYTAHFGYPPSKEQAIYNMSKEKNEDI